jgi:hypothetical protein
MEILDKMEMWDCRSTNGGAPLSSGTLFGSAAGGWGGWVMIGFRDW